MIKITMWIEDLSNIPYDAILNCDFRALKFEHEEYEPMGAANDE